MKPHDLKSAVQQHTNKTNKMNASLKGKCICQICTCGRHRCPHNRGTLGMEPVKGECALKSEYQAVYEMWKDQERRHAIRPPMRPHTDPVPMEKNTIYRQAYIEQPVVAHIVKPKREYVPTTMATGRKSTYMGDYKGQVGKRSDTFKPTNIYKPRESRFCEGTSYGDTYKAFQPSEWEWCRSRPMRHKESICYSPTTMDTDSVMKTDFVRHENPERAELIRPPNHANVTQIRGTFDPETTYRNDYTTKQPGRMAEGRRPNDYKPPTEPFEGKTTFRSDYQPHVNAPRAPCHKPQVGYHPSKGKFLGTTTFTDAYKEWPVSTMEKPSWSIRRTTKDTTPFSKTSSYQDDYVKPENHERTRLANPGNKEATFNHGGPFETSTQYRDHFQKFENVRPAASFKTNHAYESPQKPLDAESVYQADYKGERVSPAEICAPTMQTNRAPRQPLSCDTTYVEAYKGDRPLSCPATEVLKGEKSGVDPIKTASTEYHAAGTMGGHHYYEPKLSQLTKVAGDKGASTSAGESAKAPATRGTGDQRPTPAANTAPGRKPSKEPASKASPIKCVRIASNTQARKEPLLA